MTRQWDVDYEEGSERYAPDSLARARAKFEEMRKPGPKRPAPVGRLILPTLGATVFLIAPAAGLAYLAYRLWTNRSADDDVGAWIALWRGTSTRSRDSDVPESSSGSWSIWRRGRW